MGATFNIQPKELFDDILNEIDIDIETALDDSAAFMSKQLDLSFENKGFLNVNKRGEGFEPYQPTTRSAKKGRKNFPTGGGKVGKKGFTQKQAQYMHASNSLEDTGAMRSSIAIEEDNKKTEKIRYIGAGVPYIETHEDGGRITVDGKSFEVPPRRFQHITSDEIETIIEAFEAAMQ